MRNSDMAVVVRGIRKTYGEVVALADISFDVGRGEVIGLLGPNAAGKTTMVDILSTLTRPDRGSATVAGYDVASEPAWVRRSIMVTGQQVAVDDMLSGEQNLVMFGRLYGLSKSIGAQTGGGTAAAIRPCACREAAGEHLLGRDASTDRHRVRIGGPTPSGVLRRAHHRAGSEESASYLGSGGQLQEARHRHAVDHAVSRGGGCAQ